MSSERRIILIVIALGGLALFGVNHAMSILNIKASLPAPWRDRFQDVNQLNKYAKANPVDLANVKIENKNIDGAVINKGLFKDTDWKEVSAKDSSLSNVVFRNGLIENVNFNGSTMTNVVFEDVTLRGVRFVNTALHNVKFVHCTLNGLNIDQTNESHIEVSRSRIINTSLSDGQLIAVFKDSILTKETSLTDLKEPSSLTFDKCKLSKVSIERSKLHDLMINDTEFDSIFDVGSAENIVVNKSVLDASFSATKIGSLSVSDSTIKNLSVLRSKIKSVSLENCSEMNNFGMFQSIVGSMQFSHCKINDFRPIEAKIEDLNINKSSITNSTFEDMKAKSATFDNVTFEGNVIFTNAHIDDLQTNNVTKQPGLKLVTDGSNVMF